MAAVAAVVLVAGSVRYTKVKFDAGLATILAAFFGLGMMLLTYVQRGNNPAQSGLSKFIFGQAATMLARDVYITAIVAAIILIVTLLFWKELKVVAFDGEFARSMHISVRGVNFVYGLMLVATIIIGLQSVGAILMSSLLIAPAVAARQWTDKLGTMAFLAGMMGAASCFAGTLWSATVGKMPTGPAIVIVASVIVLVSLLVAPRRGVLARWQQRRRQRREWKGGEMNVSAS